MSHLHVAFIASLIIAQGAAFAQSGGNIGEVQKPEAIPAVEVVVEHEEKKETPAPQATEAPAPTSSLIVNAATPKLVVCLSIDQFRWDYFPKFNQYLGEDGFKRIVREGQVTFECNFEYGNTVTAAGHTTMMTGVNPRHHGIIGNGFWSRTEKRSVHNSADEKTKTVTMEGVTNRNGYSAFRRQRPTVGDDLYAATGGKAKMLSIALKDRSAIMMAAAKGGEVYWFDSAADEFSTSTAYANELAPWLKEWQSTRPQDRWIGKEWKKKLADEEYLKHCTIDDFAGESAGKFPKTFPKMFEKKAGTNYYDQLETSPFGDLLTTEAAIAGMKALEMGKDDVPDLLTISLSSFDKAGHQYGADSWEMMDFFLYTDETVAMLLGALDEQVGAGNYLLLITADHGVCPLPEFANERGFPAGRINERALVEGAEKFLDEKFGETMTETTYIVDFDNPFLIFDPNRGDLRPNVEELAAATDEWLQQVVGVANSFTRQELDAATPDDKEAWAARLSTSETGGGDVYILTEPFYYFSYYPLGTTHGTPHEYDTRVPMMAFGAGYGKFSPENPEKRDLPEAKSPRFMATAARTALALPIPKDE